MIKKKRIVDRGLLDFIKTLKCVVCSDTPCDPDHITTRGAGGDDIARNVWPLCRSHHNERGQIGLPAFVRKYASAQAWMERAGRFDILERAKMKKVIFTMTMVFLGTTIFNMTTMKKIQMTAKCLQTTEKQCLFDQIYDRWVMYGR